VDREASCYRRTIYLEGHNGVCEVSLHPDGNALKVSIHFPETRLLFAIVERMRSMFDLDADWREITACLKTDTLLRPLLLQSPGLRPPGCWNGFELAVRAILGQQVTVKGATTLTGRLVEKFGKPLCSPTKNQNHLPAIPGLTHIFPAPDAIAEADVASIGLPAARAESLRALARAVAANRIAFTGVVDAADFRRQLCELPGIGSWTAEYVAMRALRDPDAFPSSDLGLLKAAGIKSPRELEARAEPWRPWRAYAAMCLWTGLGSGSGNGLVNGLSSSVDQGLKSKPAAMRPARKRERKMPSEQPGRVASA
jgi:AraC family transcriptional regulator, regulatory protein of adaptative response / DNA-3-methyladenine glycosylase II